MKRWAILVAALYCLMLAVLTLPVGMLAFSGNDFDFKRAAGVYAEWGYWSWLLVMFLAQAALLAVPVRFASRRPVTRGSLLPTVLASGLMMSGLVIGGIFAIVEFGKLNPDDDPYDWYMLAVLALSWCLWSLIFFRWGRKEKHGGLYFPSKPHPAHRQHSRTPHRGADAYCGPSKERLLRRNVDVYRSDHGHLRDALLLRTGRFFPLRRPLEAPPSPRPRTRQKLRNPPSPSVPCVPSVPGSLHD